MSRIISRTIFFIFGVIVFWVILAGTVYASPALPVERMVLSNGLIVLVSEEHSLPFVTMRLLMEAGSRFDPPGEEGLAYITARGLLLGTSRVSAREINESVDFMGASLNVSPDKDYVTAGLRVLRKDLDRGFGLLAETLMRPIFPEDELKREIQTTLGSIRSEEDDPGAVAEKAFEKHLFSGNPYGHPVEGTSESLPRITRESVVRFYKEHYFPNKAILVVAGDITPVLETWQRGKERSETFPTLAGATGTDTDSKIVRIDRPITQANIIIGNKGISRGNPDFYTLAVMNYILGGGGFSSRLMQEVRGKRGLAYSVSSEFETHKYPGSFQIVLQTKNASAQEAMSIGFREMERIRNELVTEEEIEGAKKYLTGSFPMRLDTQAKVANFLTQVEYYGLGLDYPLKYPSLIASVTREDVLRVARAYLQPKGCLVVIVANPGQTGLDSPKPE
ncbi:MAG: Peptidase M16 inactive domain protein [Syntrophorhabdus sp. PtaU1.Bin153]|nr:MAG: Peptidase M16 inactive domain protein [Syntrophorhabdus sp. PtaU1.Bin153]